MPGPLGRLLERKGGVAMLGLELVDSSPVSVLFWLSDTLEVGSIGTERVERGKAYS